MAARSSAWLGTSAWVAWIALTEPHLATGVWASSECVYATWWPWLGWRYRSAWNRLRLKGHLHGGFVRGHGSTVGIWGSVCYKLTQSILIFAELAGAPEVTCCASAPSVEGQTELVQRQAVQSTCHHCFGPARWACPGSAEQAEEGWGNKISKRVTLPCGELSSPWHYFIQNTAPNCRGFSEASGDFVRTSVFSKAAPSKSTAMQTSYLWVCRFKCVCQAKLSYSACVVENIFEVFLYCNLLCSHLDLQPPASLSCLTRYRLSP